MKKRLLNILMIAQIIFCATMLVSCNNSEKRKKADNVWIAKMEQAIGKGDFTEARVCASNLLWYTPRDSYNKIARAQIGFLLNSGSVDQAYSVAQEENLTAVFTKLFMPKLSEIYESQGKTKVLQFLTKVEFGYTPDLTDTSIWHGQDDNSHYNDAVIRYNSMLEQFIGYIDITGDKEFATQLLRFVKPIVVEVKDKNGRSESVKLSEQPKADIKKKLGL